MVYIYKFSDPSLAGGCSITSRSSRQMSSCCHCSWATFAPAYCVLNTILHDRLTHCTAFRRWTTPTAWLCSNMLAHCTSYCLYSSQAGSFIRPFYSNLILSVSYPFAIPKFSYPYSVFSSVLKSMPFTLNMTYHTSFSCTPAKSQRNILYLTQSIWFSPSSPAPVCTPPS